MAEVRCAAPDREQAIGLIGATASLLFKNGETTLRLTEMIASLGAAFRLDVELLPAWGALTLRVRAAGDDRDLPEYRIFDTEPLAVDLNKVSELCRLVTSVRDGATDFAGARAGLERIAALPPASTIRFALLCGAGATALAVIFGVDATATLISIFLTAIAGGFLRRGLARLSPNALVQPLAAALLAGLCAAIASRTGFDDQHFQWIAICPCMILVPGPHLLNGCIDLARGRASLGVARIAYASVLMLMVCIGLLSGLAIGGVTLPLTGDPAHVPFAFDVIAAGIAVAAYGTFYSMPWRLIGVPMAIGMFAHGIRWVVMLAGGSLETGTFAACAVISLLVTAVAGRLGLPFAAFAFTASVSMIPGVYLFRMASGVISATYPGASDPSGAIVEALLNGAIAGIVLVIIAFGLIGPRMCLEFAARKWGERPLRP